MYLWAISHRYFMKTYVVDSLQSKSNEYSQHVFVKNSEKYQWFSAEKKGLIWSSNKSEVRIGIFLKYLQTLSYLLILPINQ